MEIKQLWNKILGLYNYTPRRIKILPENTDRADELKEPFKENKHYFEIAINEMFLSEKNNKGWLNTYDPMVFITAEFQYDSKPISAPFVIGPSLTLKDKGQKLPKDGGMIYKNISVGGRNPYKGGPLAISLILNQFPYESPLKKLLNVVETATNAYSKDIFPMLGNYLKIANIVVDGMAALADSKEVKPLIGIRENYDDGNINPGYFALINADSDQLDREHFFVVDNELLYGETKDTAKPFRDNDYVLYSILKKDRRSDYETLPYFALWKELDTFVSQYPLASDNKSVDMGKLKQEGNRRLFSIGNVMRLSPDLTGEQYAELYVSYKAQLDQLYGMKETLSGTKEKYKEPERAEWEKKFEAINEEILN